MIDDPMTRNRKCKMIGLAGRPSDRTSHKKCWRPSVSILHFSKEAMLNCRCCAAALISTATAVSAKKRKHRLDLL